MSAAAGAANDENGIKREASLSDLVVKMVERLAGTAGPGILGKDEVAGSNPAISSIEKP